MMISCFLALFYSLLRICFKTVPYVGCCFYALNLNGFRNTLIVSGHLHLFALLHDRCN